MMMHEHDQELIMALAAGSLDQDAAVAAEAAIAACAECRRDLELQVLALSVIRDAPEVYLTATESARLHDALHDELSLTPPTRHLLSRKAARGRWIGYAVGVAAVFLGAVVLLPALIGGSNDDSADNTIAAEAFAETADDLATATTAAASAVPEAPEGTLNDRTDMAADVAGGETANQAATTEAGLETGLPMFAAPLTASDRARVLQFVEEGTSDFFVVDKTARAESPDMTSCIALVQDEVLPGSTTTYVVGTIVGEDGIQRYLVAFVPADADGLVLAAVSVAPCDVFSTFP